MNKCLWWMLDLLRYGHIMHVVPVVHVVLLVWRIALHLISVMRHPHEVRIVDSDGYVLVELKLLWLPLYPGVIVLFHFFTLVTMS